MVDSLKIVQSHKGYFLNVRLRVTALKMLMTGRAKDLYEDWEDSIMTTDSEACWEQLVNKVSDYATRRRLEANLAKGKNAMDVDGVDGGEDDGGWNMGYYDDWGNWVEYEQGDIDALGKGKYGGKGGKKGKGKGKGSFNGACWECGEHGHSARFCPKGKDKGKGVMQDSRDCYKCGQKGHIARDCPQGTKGKGKGKGYGYGYQGKGINGVDDWWWQSQQQQ